MTTNTAPGDAQVAERRVMVLNKLGMHARAAAKLVKLAAAFDSDITLTKAEKTADAGSILAVMMLAAAQGSELRLRARGADAERAADAVCRLFADFFGEGE